MEKYFTLEERIHFLISKASSKTKPTQQQNALKLLSEALEYIATVSDDDSKTSYLNQVADICKELDLIETCLAVSNQALEVAQILPKDSSKARELSKLGNRYGKLGLVVQGLELLEHSCQIAQTIDDVDEKDFTLCDIACAYGDIGQLDKVFEIASLIQDEFDISWRVYIPLACDAILQGDHSQVFKLLQADNYTSMMMQEIISLYTELGDYEHPLQFIEVIDDSPSKISALIQLAKSHLAANHKETTLQLLDQADAIAQTIPEKNPRAFAQDLIDSIRAKVSS